MDNLYGLIPIIQRYDVKALERELRECLFWSQGILRGKSREIQMNEGERNLGTNLSFSDVVLGRRRHVI